jgi:hypothetical protein
MEDNDFKTQAHEAYIKLSNEIVQRVRRNLRKVDKEGFAFLTNTKKGAPAPFEFARGYGIIHPIFIIKKAYDKYGNEMTGHESWWVRDESNFTKK